MKYCKKYEVNKLCIQKITLKDWLYKKLFHIPKLVFFISINKQSYATTQETHQLQENKLSPYFDAYTPARYYNVKIIFLLFHSTGFISHICNEITFSNIDLFGTGIEYIIIGDRF